MNTWIKCSAQMTTDKEDMCSKDILLCNSAGDIWVGHFEYEDYKWYATPTPLHGNQYFIPEYWMELPMIAREEND